MDYCLHPTPLANERMAVQRNKVVSLIFRGAVAVACLAAAIGIFAFLYNTAPKPPASDVTLALPRVQVMRATLVPVQRQWEGFGTAQSMETANVPSRVTSTVTARPDEIRSGRTVRKGQLLVKLDDSDFVRQVEIATQAIADIEAQLRRLELEEKSLQTQAELAAEDARLARADVERVREALARDAARQREVDQAQQLLNAAQQAEVVARESLDAIAPRRASLQAQQQREQATLRLASQNVERSQIASPIDGVLQTVDVEVGENVTAGQSVARVVNLARIEVPLVLTSAARPFVNIADQVVLRQEGARGTTWPATVTRIAPENDQSTRTMRVFVEVSGSAGQAPAPGQFVQGRVISSESQPRWIAPRRAVDRDRVYLVNDGRIVSRAVAIDFGIEGEFPAFGVPDREWLVLKGLLPENALLVIDSSRRFVEGSNVEPVLAGGSDDQIVKSSAPLTEPTGDSSQ